MNRLLLRCFPGLLIALPLSAQTVDVSNIFVFKGTVYQQTSSSDPTILENPQPHAPGPYYIDIVVSGPTAGDSISPAPSFEKPGDVTFTNLTRTDSTRWDFKAGYTTAQLGRTTLDLNYPSGTYVVQIPGFDNGSGGNTVSLSLTGNVYPTDVPGLPAASNSGLVWTNNDLVINPAAITRLNFTPFSQWGTNSSYVYRERLAFVSPSGNVFGPPLQLSAFSGDNRFDYFDITPGFLTPGTEYRVVLEYDIFSTYIDSIGGAQAGAIYSNQTQFFITAIPEPSTYALFVGFAFFLAAAWHQRRRPRS